MEVINVYEIKDFKKSVRVSKKVVDEDKVVIHFHFYLTDSKVQPHRHADAVDVYYVVEGEGKATIGDEERRYSKGSRKHDSWCSKSLRETVNCARYSCAQPKRMGF